MNNAQGKKSSKDSKLSSYSSFSIPVEKEEEKTYLEKSKGNEQASGESRLYTLL